MNEQLDTVGIETIRAVCNEQSRSQWTTIASRELLYQFMAMSDEETQGEMRQKLSKNGDRSTVESNEASTSLGTKR